MQVAELTEGGGGPPEPGSRRGSQKGVEARPCAGFLRSSGLMASVYLGGGKLVDTKRRNHPASESVSAQSCLFSTPWSVSRQAPLSMGFSRQEYCSGLPFPSLGHLLDPGIKPRSPALQASSFLTEPPGKPHNPGRSRDRPKEPRAGIPWGARNIPPITL